VHLDDSVDKLLGSAAVEGQNSGVSVNTLRIHSWARRHYFALIVLLATFIFVLLAPAFARRAIPNDYLAYPVFITLKTARTFGYACGFYLNTGRAVYLVTAKHVLADGVLPADSATQKLPDGEIELLSYSKDLPIRKRVVLAVNLSILRENGDVRFHPSEDVVDVQLATVGAPIGGKSTRTISLLPGVTMKESSENDMLTVPLAAIKTFDQVAVGNDAILYGYPLSLGIPSNPQFDFSRPLLRKAIVAGRDPQKRSIIVDGADRGNSGSPVFEIDPDGEGYKLIGLVIDRLSSRYSVVKPIDFVLDLIK